MRLVTFTDGSGFERAGALLENDQIVLDLQAACRELQGRERAELVSVLALVEAGEDGLALARSLVERVPAQAVRERALVKLRAPIQPPPQMRD
ncbi:fumarylacetoacetate hydrolase family protein, partial [Pseudomonas paraeruginosa]